MLAIIDGNSEDVDKAYEFLKLSFGYSRSEHALKPDTDAVRLEDMLEPLTINGTSIAMALWSRSTIEVACRGGSGAYIFRRDGARGGADEVLKSDSGGIAQAGRFELSPEDALILVDSAVATHVQDIEIQQEGRSGFGDGFTEQHAAVWLATLALRLSDSAGVVIADFSGRAARSSGNLKLPRVLVPSLPAIHLKLPGARPRRRRVSNRGKLVFVSVLGCVFVLGGTLALLKFGTRLTVASLTASPTVARVQSSEGPSRVSVVPTSLAVKGGSPSPQSWKFPAMSHAPKGKVVLTLFNPSKTAVTAEIRTLGSRGVRVRTAHILAGKTVSLVLASSQARNSQGQVTTIYVQTSKPVVPLGIVVGR